MPRFKTKKAPPVVKGSWRASWKGRVKFGLVSFEVEAVNIHSSDDGDIHFHQLHEQCHHRIKYEKVCPTHGPVKQSEIVSGYEYQKGKYVEIEPGELDELRSDQEKGLTIDHFIASDQLDALFFDGRMYYLVPSSTDSLEAYQLLTAALEKEDRYGIGHILMSGKDQIIALRPKDGVLIMMMLNYDAEIRDIEQFKPSAKKVEPRQLKLAMDLIESWSSKKFDFHQYEDQYRHRVEELIQEKIAGKETVDVPDDRDSDEEPPVINLMDALRKSMKKETATPRKKSIATAKRGTRTAKRKHA
jgi:DNA end-binding protein Ku